MALNPQISAKAVSLSSRSQLNTLAGGGTLSDGTNTYSANEATMYLLADDRIVTATAAPTTSTVGYVGQMILITTAGSEALYICTAADSTYTWKQITLS